MHRLNVRTCSRETLYFGQNHHSHGAFLNWSVLHGCCMSMQHAKRVVHSWQNTLFYHTLCTVSQVTGWSLSSLSFYHPWRTCAVGNSNSTSQSHDTDESIWQVRVSQAWSGLLLGETGNSHLPSSHQIILIPVDNTVTLQRSHRCSERWPRMFWPLKLSEEFETFSRDLFDT